MEQRRERSFIMVKPDAVQRGLIHNIVVKLEKRGFKLVAMKLSRPDKCKFEAHYAEHKGKPFYEKLIKFAASGPVCAMIWEGDDIIATSRKMIGVTDPQKAAIGTFRGDFGLDMGRNSIHGSDSPESAAREIGIWFTPQELCSFKGTSEPWIYEKIIEPKSTQLTKASSGTMAQRILQSSKPAVSELDRLIFQMETSLGKPHTVSPFTQLYAKYETPAKVEKPSARVGSAQK